MRCLLDTHSFLWAAFSPEQLSPAAAQCIRDLDNEILVSVITFWEISLKHALGKLDLTGVTPDELPEVASQMGVQIIGLTAQEAAGFHHLPRLAHKDPFDRLIIWQAIQRRNRLISRDRSFKEYRASGLKLLW